MRSSTEVSSVGKHVAGKLYAHVSVLSALSERDNELAQRAIAIAGLVPGEQFQVVRISETADEVALLAYPRFFEDAFPALAASWRFDPATESIRFRDYAQSLNPPILHRKELLITAEHPSYSAFCQTTRIAEELGLFQDSTQIGYLQSWLSLVQSKGYELEGNTLRPIGNTADAEPFDPQYIDSVSIERHRTALTRNSLSAPVQCLLRNNLLTADTTFFDYGCGKGSDLEGLTSLGFSAAGWDPYFKADIAPVASDVVNLGFVINVIEDFDERVAALQRAFSITRKVLAVSAMLTHSTPHATRAYRDGVVSSRNTFQKYYSQEELRQFIESVLDEEAVAVGQGIFLVFKRIADLQGFLLNKSSSSGRVVRALSLEWRRIKTMELPRKQSRPSIPEDPALARLAHQLWGTYIELGRPPEEDEVVNVEELVNHFGSFSRARRSAVSRHDVALLEASAKSRSDDILVMLALRMFSKRKQFNKLDIRLQRDIKALFGSLARAEDASRTLLFSVSDVTKLQAACQTAAESGLGWLEPGHSLQLHTSLVERLSALLRIYVGCATILFGDISDIDLVKLHIQSGKVSLMRFQNFAETPVPLMIERVKVRLRDQQADVFTYTDEFPPPLLYNKSRYINEEFPRYGEQVEFDTALEQLKLFDLSGYGPPAKAFYAGLKGARWAVQDFSLRRSTDIPSLDDPCGANFRFRDLIECGDTWQLTKINNVPQFAQTFNAIADLARYVLDPAVEYFGSIKLTYGFCSRALGKAIKKNIAPKLDQHASYEQTRTGELICSRGGAAVDFLVENEDMKEVANWIQCNLPFDRLYVYGESLPVHVSYGPENKRDFIVMNVHDGRRVPSRRA